MIGIQTDIKKDSSHRQDLLQRRSVTERIFRVVTPLSPETATGMVFQWITSFRFVKSFLLDFPAGAKLVSSMNQMHFSGKSAEIHRLFHGRVTAPHNCDFHIAEKRTVANRAITHSLACKLQLPRYAQSDRRGPCGQDQDAAGVNLAPIRCQ